MRFGMIKILLLLNFIVILTFANDIRNHTEESIEKLFGGDVEYEMIKFHIPADLKSSIENEVKQKFFADEIYIWKIKQGNNLKGYALLDNVYGKSMPITFLVIFDKELKIANSSIVKYREPYGGAVGNESWNAQFKGKNGNSNYNVGSDISAISGATISVHSVSKGVRKLALLLPKITDRIK